MIVVVVVVVIVVVIVVVSCIHLLVVSSNLGRMFFFGLDLGTTSPTPKFMGPLFGHKLRRRTGQFVRIILE